LSGHFDNFEQVSRYVRGKHWGDGQPSDRGTLRGDTREVLGLVGEETLALRRCRPRRRALFVQRAESAKPDFQPTEEDSAAVDRW